MFKPTNLKATWKRALKVKVSLNNKQNIFIFESFFYKLFFSIYYCFFYLLFISLSHLPLKSLPHVSVCCSFQGRRTSCFYWWSNTRYCGMGHRIPPVPQHRTTHLSKVQQVPRGLNVEWQKRETKLHKCEKAAGPNVQTCRVFAGCHTDWILKVRNALVTKVQMIVASLIQKISAVQIGLDHLLFGNSGCEEIHRQQRKTHLCEKSQSDQDASIRLRKKSEKIKCLNKFA